MLKNILKLLSLILLIALFQIFWGWQNLYAQVQAFAEANANPFYFLFIMSIFCAFGFPVSWCYFFSATAFGLGQAWGLCLIGLLFSSLLGFFAAKAFLPSNWNDKILCKFKIKSDCLTANYHANFFIRAIPGVPYFLQNFILTGIKTPLSMYLIMTLLVQGPIALGVNIISASLKNSAYEGIFAGICLILILTAIHRLMLKYYKRTWSLEEKELEQTLE